MYHRSYTMFIVWVPLSGGIKSRTWQGRILGPQFANQSNFVNWSVQFANGQSSCIGRNIYITLDDTKAKCIITNQRHVSRLRKYVPTNRPLHVIELEPLLDRFTNDSSVPRDNLQLDTTSS
jgi:hypothetical protein